MDQAIILAGGKGTRLRERLGGLPKPLIDICGVPLLERQILLLKEYGYKNIKILVNYKAEIILEFCKSKGNWGIDIECIDDGEPRGTAGAVLGIPHKLENEFLVMYGDTMLDVNLHRFYIFHREVEDIAASLFLHPNDHPQDSDIVEIDDSSFVKNFYPYPHPPGLWLPNLVNAALYIVKKAPLLLWSNHNGPLDFAKELFPCMLKDGLRLRGYNSPEYIKDIGTPTRVDKVNIDFLSGKIINSNLHQKQCAVFIDRDGTINKEIGHLSKLRDFELLPGVKEAIKTLNKSKYRTCVVTNQPVISRGDCTVTDLKIIHNKMETLLAVDGAYIDRIAFCPHHPDSGFKGEVKELKIECDCRKPKTGMIDKMLSDLNIEKNWSWMIGDSTSDVLAAKNSNIRSILVQTGYAGLDGRYCVTPDYVVPGLLEAVDFIINRHPKLKEALGNLANTFKKGGLVFVGGHARSGKSTIASILKECCKDLDIECHILSTDRWLKSHSERVEGVLGRHQISELRTILSQLIKRTKQIEIPLPFYSKKDRHSKSSFETIKINPNDMVIIEGVIALGLEEGNWSGSRLFVEIDENIRKKRFIHEYSTRNEADIAEILYLKRFFDEWKWIESTGIDSIKFDVTKY